MHPRSLRIAISASLFLLALGLCFPHFAWADDRAELATISAQGRAAYDRGDYPAAAQAWERSLELAQRVFGPDHIEVARSLNNLGTLYCAMGQFARAEPLYERSLGILEPKLGPDHPDVARVGLHNLACLHAKTGQWSEAAVETDRGRRIVRRHAARTLPILSENEQLAFLQAQDEKQLHIALSLGLRKRDDAEIAQRSAAWVLNGKAVAQEALAQRAILATEASDLTLADLVKRLLDVRTQLARLSATMPKPGLEAEYRQQLAALGQQEQELSRKLGQATGRGNLGDPWVELSAVRQALTKDAVLVEVARFEVATFKTPPAAEPAAQSGTPSSPGPLPRAPEGTMGEGRDERLPPHYVAWVIPAEGQGEIAIVDLGEALAIDEAVGLARKELEQSGKTIAEAGEAEAEKRLGAALQKVAKQVFEPLESQLGRARELILSPDAALWLVPWGSLPLADGTYAIEKYQIRYVISGRDLVNRGPGRKPTGPILFADPDYDLAPGAAETATRTVLQKTAPPEQVASSRGASGLAGLGRAGRLPGTARETAAIKPTVASYAGAEPVLYEGQYALEGVFKAAHRPRVLVLSTHGFFLPDQQIQQQIAARRQAAGAAHPFYWAAFTLTGESARDNRPPIETPVVARSSQPAPAVVSSPAPPSGSNARPAVSKQTPPASSPGSRPSAAVPGNTPPGAVPNRAPARFKPGGKAVVVRDGVKLMFSGRVIAVLDKGTELTVGNIGQGWIAGHVMVGDTRKAGYVDTGDLQPLP